MRFPESATEESPDGHVPHGYVPYSRVREALPDSDLVEVSDLITLETLYLAGPSPEIVFVHGGLGSLWNPYPHLYAFRGTQGILTYALAGNGRSTASSEQTLEGHVTDLRRLISRFGLQEPIIHGHSYGTAVALEYAKRHPCKGLILHAGGDHDLTPSWEKPLLRLFLTLRLYRVMASDTLMRILARRAACHEATPEVLIEDFLQSNPMPRRRSAWETVTEAFWGYDGRGDIDRIEAPTLVIHGPADRIVPLDVARETARRIPNGEFCLIRRSGHIAMIERPAMYNQLLCSFIEAIQKGHCLKSVIPDEA